MGMASCSARHSALAGASRSPPAEAVTRAWPRCCSAASACAELHTGRCGNSSREMSVTARSHSAANAGCSPRRMSRFDALGAAFAFALAFAFVRGFAFFASLESAVATFTEEKRATVSSSHRSRIVWTSGASTIARCTSRRRRLLARASTARRESPLWPRPRPYPRRANPSGGTADASHRTGALEERGDDTGARRHWSW